MKIVTSKKNKNKRFVELTKTTKKSWLLDDESADFWPLQIFEKLNVLMPAFELNEFTKNIFVSLEFQPTEGNGQLYILKKNNLSLYIFALDCNM